MVSGQQQSQVRTRPKRLEPAVETYALAIDFANYAGELKTETIEAWRQAGVKRVIIRAANPYDENYREHLRIVEQQIEMCRYEFEVQLYCWLYWGAPIIRQIDAAKAQANGYIERIWLDCEEAPEGIGYYDPVVDIDIAWASIGNVFSAGIYTGGWFWRSYVRNTAVWAESAELWDASPDGVANFDYWASHKYGGWDMPVMKQYGSEILGGVEVDVNVYKT